MASSRPGSGPSAQDLLARQLSGFPARGVSQPLSCLESPGQVCALLGSVSELWSICHYKGERHNRQQVAFGGLQPKRLKDGALESQERGSNGWEFWVGALVNA